MKNNALILDIATEGFWEWDLKRGKAYLSPHYCELIGFSPEESAPDISLFWRIVHPNDQARVQAAMEEHVLGLRETSKIEYRMYSRDGTEKWVERRCKVVEYDSRRRPSRMAGTITDITERKQMEKALHDSYTLLQKTFASLNEAVFIVQTGTRIIQDCNITVEKMFGYRREEMIGASTSCLHVTEQMAQHFGAEMLKGYEEKGYFETTYKMRRKDGTVFDSEHCVTPIRDDYGSVTSHVCVVRDITERRRTETKLHEQAALLEREAAARQKANEELKAKQYQLEALNNTLEERISSAITEIRQKDQMLIHQSRQAAMGEMMHNIAHQWRQPLSNVGLIVQNLQTSFETGELTAEKMDLMVARAMDCIMYMSLTINDFSNFFRKDKEWRVFMVNRMVSRAVDFLLPSLKSSGIEIRCDQHPEISAGGYPNEYLQALLNILTNARDVLLEQQVPAPRIDVGIFRDNGRAVVTVRDNGGGIPEDDLLKIFDPYFTTKKQGAGIGLYMSKTIIEKNMAGNLKVRNIDGGAEFRMEVGAP